MRVILRLLLCVVGVCATLLALAYWDKATSPEYVSVYSDDDLY